VKLLMPFVSLIHAVDSVKLLREIEKQAAKVGRKVDCLLELHVAQEETKYGFSPDEVLNVLADEEVRKLEHVRICGLMTMATYTEDKALIRSEFELARQTFEQVRTLYFMDEPLFCELSMGMSHDYGIAVEEGSTLVRVGTKIFGERYYG
jgi:pyridoxal phosphate enzyme (YggS family)